MIGLIATFDQWTITQSQPLIGGKIGIFEHIWWCFKNMVAIATLFMPSEYQN